MELKVGKMSSREIADWMGISYNTYKNHIKKYITELDYYCDYEPVYGGVKISAVYVSIYIKDLASKDCDTYLQLVKESNGLCSLSGMARKLQSLYPDTWGQLSFYTIKNRLRKAGIAMFGQTNFPTYKQEEEHHSGPYGYREYCWAVKVSNLNEYRFLTEEEDRIFDTLLDSYNINSRDIALREVVEKDLKQKLLNDDITKEEYVAATSQIEFFPDLLFKFKQLTGLTLVHATYHDVLDSTF